VVGEKDDGEAPAKPQWICGIAVLHKCTQFTGLSLDLGGIQYIPYTGVFGNSHGMIFQ
jgi:hypothetical protein